MTLLISTRRTGADLTNTSKPSSFESTVARLSGRHSGPSTSRSFPIYFVLQAPPSAWRRPSVFRCDARLRPSHGSCVPVVVLPAQLARGSSTTSSATLGLQCSRRQPRVLSRTGPRNFRPEPRGLDHAGSRACGSRSVVASPPGRSGAECRSARWGSRSSSSPERVALMPHVYVLGSIPADLCCAMGGKIASIRQQLNAWPGSLSSASLRGITLTGVRR